MHVFPELARSIKNEENVLQSFFLQYNPQSNDSQKKKKKVI